MKSFGHPSDILWKTKFCINLCFSSFALYLDHANQYALSFFLRTQHLLPVLLIKEYLLPVFPNDFLYTPFVHK